MLVLDSSRMDGNGGCLLGMAEVSSKGSQWPLGGWEGAEVELLA